MESPGGKNTGLIMIAYFYFMKTSSLLLLWVLFTMFGIRCGPSQDSGKDSSDTDAPTSKDTPKVANTGAADDATSISGCITGFYRWYARNGDSLNGIDFIDERGSHLKLDTVRLQNYFDFLKTSGFVSDELLENEKRFYRACAAEWLNEQKDEVPSGLAADRFYCAQDYVAPYDSGRVSSVVSGDRAKAVLTLAGQMGENPSFKYDMKRESGRWLIARLGCDSGVPY
jgi:hypothetical protein